MEFQDVMQHEQEEKDPAVAQAMDAAIGDTKAVTPEDDESRAQAEFAALAYTPIIPRVERTYAGKLKLPPINDRFDLDARPGELDHLAEIPLDALHHVADDSFYIIRGCTILSTGLARGVPEFTVRVIGEIDTPDQAAWARALRVLGRPRPFHILEEARAVAELAEKLRAYFDVFGHGGPRNGPGYNKKISLPDAVGQHIPAVRSRVDALLRFGVHVGPFGLEGIYMLIKADRKKLGVKRIANRNSRMNAMGLREEIDKAMATLDQEGATHDEKLSVAGRMVYDVLFEPRPNKYLLPYKELPALKKAKAKQQHAGKSGYADIDPKTHKEIASFFEKLRDAIDSNYHRHWEYPEGMSGDEVVSCLKDANNIPELWTDFTLKLHKHLKPIEEKE